LVAEASRSGRRDPFRRSTAGPGHKITKTTPCKVGPGSLMLRCVRGSAGHRLSRSRHGELTRALVVLVERTIEARKADHGVVDEDVKLPCACRLDVVLDQGIGRIRFEDMLFTAGPAVAQHDPEP